MIFALLPIAAAFVAASPLNQGMRMKQALKTVPAGWEFKNAAPADLMINMHFAMKEQNMDKLQQRLLEVSDPSHADYGKHMSKADVEAMTGPSAASLDIVTKWLASHGIEAGKVSNGFISVTVTAAQAETMLGTKYGVYYNVAKELFTVRTTEYSLPGIVHDEIAMVQPTTMFSDMNMFNNRAKTTVMITNSTVLKARQMSCDNGITPSCLQSLYNVNYTPQSANTTIGVTGYLGQVASQSDLQSFLQQYTNIPSDATFSVKLVNGGSNDGDGTIEADLDTQYALGLTYPINTEFYETAGQPPFKPDAGTPTNTNEPYLDWLNYMNGLDQVPQTVTSSYGDNEQTVPRDYADSVCNQFMKLAARGVSILVSSGDGGVAGGQSSPCMSNDGSNTRKFLPTFPASCPYGVTVVGGTMQSNPEVAAGLSSGGFSDYYSAPPYQSTQTKSYVSSIGNQYSGLFNPSGRGIPDVAAQAENFQVVQGGFSTSVDGTSCSAPAFASIVALLNDYLVSQGKSPLGFLNPFLYGKGKAGLNDITQGSNPGCNTEGFAAGTGWDPVTGLGSPNFAALQMLV